MVFFLGMKSKDIIIGLVILAGLALIVVVVKNYTTRKVVPSPSPATSQTQENIERTFNLEIPEDYEKADLKDVTGGQGSAIATRNLEAGVFKHMVLADLPDPASGTFYEGWLVRGKSGDNNFAFISTGKLRIAKGGYLLEFESSKDYSDYTGVVITVEKVNDKKPEAHVLEGSF